MHGRIFNRSWHRHRFMLGFSHAPSGTATVFGAVAGGVVSSATKGYRMIRGGWLLSLYAQADITAVSGGFLTGAIRVDGTNRAVVPTWTTTGDDQTRSIQIARFRFAAGSVIAAVAVVFSTITFNDVTWAAEVELDR